MNKQFTLRAIVIMITLGTTIIGIGVTPILLQQQSAARGQDPQAARGEDPQAARKAPPAITGDNVYVAWWDNKTGNNEVFFRASTDKGQTFGDKINLSNTPNSDSTRVEIDSDVNSVVVSWWETNQTASTPVMKISTDNGKTFGPILNLSTNGTIGSSGGG
jgi:hypothetical protein